MPDGRRPTPTWTAERETRLIEMVRSLFSLEEIARELGIPRDMVERHMQELRLTEEWPEGYV